MNSRYETMISRYETMISRYETMISRYETMISRYETMISRYQILGGFRVQMEQVCKICVFLCRFSQIEAILINFGPFLANLVTSADVGIFGTFGLFWQISAFLGKFVSVRNEDFSVRNDDFSVRNDAFSVRNDDFSVRNDDFSVSNFEGISVQMEQVCKICVLFFFDFPKFEAILTIFG